MIFYRKKMNGQEKPITRKFGNTFKYLHTVTFICYSQFWDYVVFFLTMQHQSYLIF